MARPKMKMQRVGDLTPDAHNANAGNKRGQEMLQESLRRYRAGRGILIDKAGRIIAGNKTLDNAAELGFEDVVVVQTNGEQIVAVQRMDLDLAKDPAARELAIADNRVAEADLVWDAEELSAVLEAPDIDLTHLWTDAELFKLTGSASPNGTVVDMDEAEELRKKWKTKKGQLWKVGRHRLLCGDAEKAEDVAKLLGREKPRITVTDPPYGVKYDAAWRDRAAENGSIGYAARRTRKVKGDAQADWSEAWKLCPGPVMYSWTPPGDYNIITGQALLSSGFQIRMQIIWKKPALVISRGHYHVQHEPCWYAIRKGSKAYWKGDRSQSTIWEVAWDENIEGGHSTQKPLECMARPICNHEGDAYDPFVGSGTTLEAAESLERRCFAMDKDPACIAVPLERMKRIGVVGKLAA